MSKVAITSYVSVIVSSLLFAGLLEASAAGTGDQVETARLNQMQVIGTHNSYHIAPTPPMMKAIAEKSQRLADSLDYSHRPLPQQFSQFGIRQIELDIFADPEGGLYKNPALSHAAAGSHPVEDADGVMSRPGLKVLHIQDVDNGTTEPTLKSALQSVRSWLKAHPQSCPILVMLELKQSSIGDEFTQPHPFGDSELDAIDREILSVFNADEILKPDDVRGPHETLRDAILTTGWPKISEVRGKVIFAMDNENDVRDRYLEGHASLQGRLLFVSVEENHPAAAFMKINNAVQDFERIQRSVEKGFLVRTRADSGTRQSRQNDATTRDRAFASGAHFISTDYPEPDKRFSDYAVAFENVVARPNPVSGKGLTVRDFDRVGKRTSESREVSATSNRLSTIWPMWRGPNGDGIAHDDDAPLHWASNKNIAWKTPIPGKGYSSPIVWGDSIFLTSADLNSKERLLLCVNRRSGEVEWQSTVVVADIERMHPANSAASGTPATDGKRVYTLFQADGSLLATAYNYTGEIAWQRGLGGFQSRHGFHTCPVLFEGSLIVSGMQDSDDAFVLRLDRTTGDVEWQAHIDSPIRSFSTPLLIEVDGRHQVVLSGANRTYAFDASDGSALWRVQGPAEKTVSSLTYDGTHVFVPGGRDNQLFAIRPTGLGDVTDSHISWIVRRGIPYINSPLLLNGYLHIISDEGVYTRVDVKSGDTVHQARLTSKASSSPIAVGQRIYITSESGRTTVISSEPGSAVLATNDLGESVLASLAVAGGDVFIRGTEHLFCIREETP